MIHNLRTKAGAVAGLVAAALIAFAAAGFAADDDSGVAAELAPLDVHARTSIAVVDRLRHHHLIRSKPLDDDASERIFDKYLTFLDGKRLYLLATDVAKLQQYRTALDDALQQGDMEPAFDIYNTFRRRALQRVEYEESLLRRGIEYFDFSVDESVMLDRDDAPWPADADEARNLWRLALKSRVLGRKLAGETLEDIGDTLEKRVKNSRRLIGQTRSEDVFQLFINAFTQTYDKHTQYFSPRDSEDFNIHMSLSLEGIGAVLGTKDEYTIVHRLVKGGPADLGGDLRPNDRIVAVAQSHREPFVDIVGRRTDEVVELIRGPKGSPVLLKVMPEGPNVVEPRIVEIVRDVVKLEDQAASSALIEVDGAARTHRIGVVVVPTFYIDFQALRQGDANYKSTTRDVARLISELRQEGLDGVIVDLRNNGGGSLQEAVELTGLFVESGPVVQVANDVRRPDVYSDSDDFAVWTGPLAVMVNRLSASASEIFAGAIQDYGLGVVVGSETFGKGTVQTLIPLQRGELKITERRFYRVSGVGTEQNGVSPDVVYPLPERRSEESSKTPVGAIDTPGGTVAAANYQASNRVAPVLETLRLRHAERVQDDPEFAYLRARKERFELTRSRTSLSLREDIRLAEKEADDAWFLDVENKRLMGRGEEPAATIDELVERRESDGFEPLEPEEDALVLETANVLVDFIDLSRPLASAAAAKTAFGGTSDAAAVH